MRRVVLESPYAGDVERNVAYAKLCLLDCLKRGEAPIASHLLWTQEGILNDDNPKQREKGIAAGVAWHWVSDAVVFYTDFGWSRGMRDALEKAVEFGNKYETRQLPEHVLKTLKEAA